MSLGLTTSLMQMPSARQLLDLALRDLRSGRSVLGLLPEGVDSSLLWSALWDGLEHLHLHAQEIAISDLDAQMPVEALGQAMGVDWGGAATSRTVGNLLKQVGCHGPEILFFEGFNELAEESRVQWLRFMEQWAQKCQGRDYADTIPPALCLLAKAAKVPYPLPATNVLLSIHVWRGIPTAAEMRLLCQVASEHDAAPLSRWKEHTIPAVASSDLELVDYLWTENYREGRELTGVLQAFAERRGWNQDELEAWPVHRLPQEATAGLDEWPLSSRLYRAWAQGTVHWTPEHGLERHSAVLAMLDQQEALDHRLWRGQAGFLLTQIDQIRLALCAHLNAAYGQDWPYKWQEPETDIEYEKVKSTPFACQWGHLKHLIQNCSELHREQRWYSLVECSWRMRTELAHYRPISLNEYEKFCWELKRSHQAGLGTAL